MLRTDNTKGIVQSPRQRPSVCVYKCSTGTESKKKFFPMTCKRFSTEIIVLENVSSHTHTGYRNLYYLFINTQHHIIIENGTQIVLFLVFHISFRIYLYESLFVCIYRQRISFPLMAIRFEFSLNFFFGCSRVRKKIGNNYIGIKTEKNQITTRCQQMICL